MSLRMLASRWGSANIMATAATAATRQILSRRAAVATTIGERWGFEWLSIGAPNRMTTGTGIPTLSRTVTTATVVGATTTNTLFPKLLGRFPPVSPLPFSWTRITARTMASKKHKNMLKLAKGFRGRAKSCFSIAIRRIHKAWQYAYRDRRRKKREWRKLWIMRLQAGVRQYHWRYSEFIPALQRANIQLNRKVLSELAANEPFAFKSVLDVVEYRTGITKRDHLFSQQSQQQTLQQVA